MFSPGRTPVAISEPWSARVGDVDPDRKGQVDAHDDYRDEDADGNDHELSLLSGRTLSHRQELVPVRRHDDPPEGDDRAHCHKHAQDGERESPSPHASDNRRRGRLFRQTLLVASQGYSVSGKPAV